MFTGIIQNLGEIINFQKNKVIIKADNFKDLKKGESICINGMCLTLEDFKDNLLTFYLSMESLKKSHPSLWAKGSKVNIERSVTPNTFLGGHIVTGHIDCIGKVLSFKDKEILKIQFPKNFEKYVVLKGSISVNGVSLTISNLKENTFEVSIVPFTLENTNLKYLRIPSPVHLEFDIIAKYLEKIFKK